MSALSNAGGWHLRRHAPEEPRLLLAGVLALLVHLIAVAALTFGFQIQTQRNEPVSAELWAALPPPAPVAKPEPARTPPEPVPTPPEPVPAPPAPKPPAPRPAPEPKPPPVKEAPPKADIEVKAKVAAKAKQVEDDRSKAEAAKKREADKAKAQALAEAKLAEAKAAEAKLAEAKAQKEAQVRQAEADRIRREQEELGRKAAEAAASAQAKLLASHVDKIRAKVRQFIVEPPGVPPTATAEFDVVLIPGGDVLSVKLRRSSGNALYDEAVERAIRRAEPLPIPPEPQLFPQFRTLLLQFRPRE